MAASVHTGRIDGAQRSAGQAAADQFAERRQQWLDQELSRLRESRPGAARDVTLIGSTLVERGPEAARRCWEMCVWLSDAVNWEAQAMKSLAMVYADRLRASPGRASVDASRLPAHGGLEQDMSAAHGALPRLR